MKHDSLLCNRVTNLIESIQLRYSKKCYSDFVDLFVRLTDLGDDDDDYFYSRLGWGWNDAHDSSDLFKNVILWLLLRLADFYERLY
jgi:hypothetical protein